MAGEADRFGAVQRMLRDVMLAEAGGMTATRDRPGHLELRTPAIDAKTGELGWFGTVTTRASYVAFHLMPLYADPALADGISDALAKRRQGKTCFNFKRPDKALFDELAALTRWCAAAAVP